MSKSTLGRGLGDLLGSNRPGETPALAPESEAPRTVDGGLRILIKGAQREVEPVREADPAAEVAPVSAPAPAMVAAAAVETRQLVPAVPAPARPSPFAQLVAVMVLIVADLALLGWTTYLAMTQPHSLGWTGIVVCVGSVLLAALCGCAAMLLINRK